MIRHVMNQYLNGLLTNQQVIDELMKLAKEIKAGKEAGNELGLTEEELAFYDALTKPEAIKDFYENAELVRGRKKMNINPNELDDFLIDLMKATVELEQKYDVTISVGRISYDQDEFTTRLTVKNGHDKEQIKRIDFDKNVWKYEYLGFTKGMYRRIFLAADGRRYAILGFNTRAKLYPLIVADILDGRIGKAPAGFVKDILNEYYVKNLIGSIEDEEL